MNPYLSTRERISTMQRWIIIQSILYYELDASIVSDRKFDSVAKELVRMQKEFPEDAEASQYYYVFEDFDGNTGFDLPDRLSENDKKYLFHLANHILFLRGGRDGKEKASKRRSNHR